MRPKIICHMMSSVDGRLIGDRWSNPFDGKTPDDVIAPYYTISLELEAQAWMVGRKTVQIHNFPHTFEHEGELVTDPKTFIGKQSSARVSIVLDPKGKILYENNHIEGDNIITILGEQVSEKYLAFLREQGISYLFAGADGNDIALAMEKLGSEFGMTKILLEGGGIINGTFLKEGLIDELSLTIYPGIDGLTGIPTIFESEGDKDSLPAQGQSLELISVKQLQDGVVWLYYKFHKK